MTTSAISGEDPAAPVRAAARARALARAADARGGWPLPRGALGAGAAARRVGRAVRRTAQRSGRARLGLVGGAVLAGVELVLGGVSAAAV